MNFANKSVSGLHTLAHKKLPKAPLYGPEPTGWWTLFCHRVTCVSFLLYKIDYTDTTRFPPKRHPTSNNCHGTNQNPSNLRWNLLHLHYCATQHTRKFLPNRPSIFTKPQIQSPFGDNLTAIPEPSFHQVHQTAALTSILELIGKGVSVGWFIALNMLIGRWMRWHLIAFIKFRIGLTNGGINGV